MYLTTTNASEVVTTIVPVTAIPWAEELDIEEGEAVHLWTSYKAAEDALPIDDDLLRMSDDELRAYITKTKQEVWELVREELGLTV